MYSRNTANGRGRGIIPPYNYGGTVYSRALRDAQDSSRPQGMVRDEEARRAGSGAGTDVGSAQQSIGGVRTVRADSAHPVGTNGMNSVDGAFRTALPSVSLRGGLQCRVCAAAYSRNGRWAHSLREAMRVRLSRICVLRERSRGIFVLSALPPEEP